MIDFLQPQGVEYTIKVPFYEWLGLKERIIKRRRWQRVDATVECFEQRLAVPAWSRSMRVVIYRKRVHHRTAKNYQLDLFDPDDGYYEYSAIVTNKAVTGRTLWFSCAGAAPTRRRTVHELRDQSLKRDELLLKLGAAKKEAGRAWHLVEIGLPKAREAVTAETFTFSLRRQRLRQARRREGRYLLRSNLTGEDPATLWRYYMQLCEIEQAFKELKHDLAIRPIFHQREDRIEAHIFVAFIAYCLHVTLKNLARPRAPGLTPRAILEKFATMQMVDVHLPTTDGRYLIPAPTYSTATGTPTPAGSTQTAFARTTDTQNPRLNRRPHRLPVGAL